MRWFRVLMVLLAVGVLACDSVSDPESGNGVIARVDNEGLIVRNLTGAPIYTFAIDREVAALTNWVKCTDPTRCDGLKHRRSARLPKERIGGWAGSADLLVYWWQLRPAPGGGFTPGPEGFMVVRR